MACYHITPALIYNGPSRQSTLNSQRLAKILDTSFYVTCGRERLGLGGIKLKSTAHLTHPYDHGYSWIDTPTVVLLHLGTIMQQYTRR